MPRTCTIPFTEAMWQKTAIVRLQQTGIGYHYCRTNDRWLADYRSVVNMT